MIMNVKNTNKFYVVNYIQNKFNFHIFLMIKMEKLSQSEDQ